MDHRAKMAIAGVIGVVLGAVLLGGALAVPAVVGHMGRTFVTSEDGYGPQSDMMDRFGRSPRGNNALRGMRGPQSGLRDGSGPYCDPDLQGAPRGVPPYGGNPGDCPAFPGSTAPTGTAG
jgi:hypothetical protein